MSTEQLVAALIIAESLMDPETRDDKIRCYTGGYLGGLLHAALTDKKFDKESIRGLLHSGVDVIIERIYMDDKLNI